MMINRLLILLISFVLYTNVLEAMCYRIGFAKIDTIKIDVDGIVLDFLTKEPVVGANVEITSSNGFFEKIITDSLGKYSIQLQSGFEYFFVVSKLGYITVKGKESTISYINNSKLFHEWSISRVCNGFKNPPKLYFRINETKPFIEDDNKEILNIYYKILIDNPNIVVQFGGSRDVTEKESISMDRAITFVNKLVEMGVKKEMIEIVDLGIRFDEKKYTETEVDKIKIRQENRTLNFKVLREN